MTAIAEEDAARARLVALGRSLHERGLAPGTSGNLSVRLADGFLLTPTGASLGWLDPERLSRLDGAGDHTGGDRPTKEAPLHLAVYHQRAGAGAVAHLHSTHAVAVSCLAGLDVGDVLPPLTAYYVMRVGRLPLVPYHPPGAVELAGAVAVLAADHHAMLLANHGPVVAGSDLDEAVAAIEEVEETARLHLLLWGHATRPLSGEEARRLRR